MFLYKLTFPNGKVYIGQTVRNMQIRFNQHKTAANRGSLLPVHCAWRKHGEPSVSIIGEYPDAEALHCAEIAAINDLGTISPNGYNIALGGGTAPSKSPIVAAKIAAAMRGKKIDNTPRRQEIARELWQSDEYRAKMSESLRAAWDDPEQRKAHGDKIKAAWARRKAEGWAMPEETKAKLRGKVFSEETRAKMSAAAKARVRGPRSAETCAKISENTKKAWQNPELTARRVAAIRAAHQSVKGSEYGQETFQVRRQDCQGHGRIQSWHPSRWRKSQGTGKGSQGQEPQAGDCYCP